MCALEGHASNSFTKVHWYINAATVISNLDYCYLVIIYIFVYITNSMEHAACKVNHLFIYLFVYLHIYVLIYSYYSLWYGYNRSENSKLA